MRSFPKLLALAALLSGVLFGAGTVASSCVQVGQGPVWTVTFSWTADASAATVPSTVAPCSGQFSLQGYVLLQVETVPGSPSPTTSYSATLTDSYGLDLAGGQLSALSSSAAQNFAITAPPLIGPLTLAILGNSVNSAQGTVILWLAPGNYAHRGAGPCALSGDATGACGSNEVAKIMGQTPAKVALSGSYTDLTNQPAIPSGNTPAFSPSQIISGLGVEYVSGLTYTVGQGSYTISGQTYSITALTPVTLSTADATNPRIDVMGVDNTGAVFHTTGTPAANPATPSISEYQIALAYALIPANSATPSGPSVTTLYDENSEWTCSPSSNINCASTSNPYHGTKDIEATGAILNNNFTLVKPASGTVNLSTQNSLIFYIRSKGAWPSGASGGQAARYLSLTWFNGSAQVGIPVVIRDGTLGFSSTVTGNYQQIAIPIGEFGTGTSLVTTLKCNISGNAGSSSIGFYIDEVTLQAGSTPATLPANLLTFLGPWQSSVAYVPNNEVVSGGIAYVALLANANQTPPNATYWTPLSPTNTTQTICSGTVDLGTSLIASGAAASTVTATCTGLASTDNIMLDFNGSPLAVTGYVPSANGILTIVKWPSTDTINVSVVNNTGSGITPGAIRLNYRVTR